jgi:glutamate/tyrosine decarboxylase-like PLP-dependent enzyme
MTEETLDPQDWTAFRALAHRAVDEAVTYMQTVRERKAWQPPPADVRAQLHAPLPVEGEGAEQVFESFRRNVLPYPTGNLHPRFWGWVMGTGTPLTAVAEMLAATMNCNVGDFDDAASLVEDQVMAWLKELMGFPADAGGLLVSGGSMANFVGLTVARDARAGFDVPRAGLSAAPKPLMAYASRETHSSVTKALQILGIGRDALRLLPVDDAFALNVRALADAVAADRREGRQPFCVVANAGTVNTGAMDPFDALADFCRAEGLWLHVDGAFGAMAALAPALRPRLRGLERADSLAFDLHKWGYFPVEVGCVLVRDAAAQRRSFTVTADYLAPVPGGIAWRSPRMSEHSPQLSRGFRALKVWMGMKEQGVAKLGRLVQQNVDQAAYLAQRVRAHPELELLAPAPLNVVCFRYAGGLPAEGLDALNRALLVRLHESGAAVPSHTLIRGAYAIRVAITNHRTRRADLDLLVDEVARLGRVLRPAAATAGEGGS